MSDSRAWPIRPKWHRYETTRSYARRQSVAAGIPFRDVERGLTSESCRLINRVWLNPTDAARTVEAAAGRAEGHYLRLLHAAQPHPAQLYPTRFLCRLCAAGDVIEQIPHDRENWCSKHPGQMVWAGPGTTPGTQVIHPFDKRQAKAERTFRRLATAGLISTRLHTRVWEMVRDNASLSQPSSWSDALKENREEHERNGRAELYPNTVAVLQILSSDELVASWIELPTDDLRPAIRAALSTLDGPNDILVERIVLWLRRHRRETRPTRIDPLNVPLDLVDVASIIDIEAVYPLWIQRRPTAVSEWDWSENDPERDPWDNVGSSISASWVCDSGHRWTSTPYVRAFGGCGCCAGQLVWRGESDLGTLFPSVAKEWDRTDGANAGSPDTVSAGSTRRIKWICRKGHSWSATVQSRTRNSSSCPYCSGHLAIPGESDLASVRPDLLAEWDFDANGELLPQLVGARSHKSAAWKGACGHSWRTGIYHRVVGGTGCPYCAGNLPTPGVDDLATTQPGLAAEWDPSNTVHPDQVRPKCGKKVRWRCKRNHTWEASPHSRASGRGCPFCSGQRVSPGETDLATLRPDLVREWHGSNTRGPQEFTVGSTFVVSWECSSHHVWQAAVRTRTGKRGTGCPECYRLARARRSRCPQ